MSHYYGSLQGGRGEVTRTGTKGSGIRATLKTACSKVRVSIVQSDGKDVVRMSVTSNDRQAYLEIPIQ